MQSRREIQISALSGAIVCTPPICAFVKISDSKISNPKSQNSFYPVKHSGYPTCRHQRSQCRNVVSPPKKNSKPPSTSRQALKKANRRTPTCPPRFLSEQRDNQHNGIRHPHRASPSTPPPLSSLLTRRLGPGAISTHFPSFVHVPAFV